MKPLELNAAQVSRLLDTLGYASHEAAKAAARKLNAMCDHSLASLPTGLQNRLAHNAHLIARYV